jgi:hypothetical protein
LSELSDSTHSLWQVWVENKWKITAAAWVAFAWISYYIKQGIEDSNVEVSVEIDVDKFWNTVEEIYKKY